MIFQKEILLEDFGGLLFDFGRMMRKTDQVKNLGPFLLGVRYFIVNPQLRTLLLPHQMFSCPCKL